MSEAEAIRRRHQELRRAYRGAYERLSAILFAEDPAGINFEHNTDEYEPEVGSILPRLRSCRSVVHVRDTVHQEFVSWFGADTAGSAEQYQRIADRIWEEVLPLLAPDGQTGG